MPGGICLDENETFFMSGSFCSGEDEALFLLGVFGSGRHRESVAFLGEDEDTSWSIGSLLCKDGVPSWLIFLSVYFLLDKNGIISL